MGVKGRSVDDSQFSQTVEMTGLRNIGHQILLSSGDRASLILPVQKLPQGAYRIRFGKPFIPIPDSLVSIFKRNLQSQEEYSIEVRELNKTEMLYSFVLSNDKTRDIVPCRGRSLPFSYYELIVRFSSNSASADLYIAGLMTMLLLGAGFTYFRKKRHFNTEPLPVDDDSSLPIGRFRFYPDQQNLLLDGQRIELTGKESRLLTIFAKSPNTVIDRVRLQKEVWEDEGVIVTRSLDMFISKLRKRLVDDQAVKIVNVHGKGYKLEIS